MIGRYRPPFALSGAALLMACLGAAHSPLYAAEGEAPAVLNFATSYLQQMQSPPQPPPDRHKLPPPVREAEGKVVSSAQVPRHDSGQLNALKQEILEKNRQIAQKNQTISTLEQQISALKQSAAVASQSPYLIASDKQTMLELVQNLRQVFSLHPTHNTLVGKLSQVTDQLKEVKLAEAALRSQLKTLTEGKDDVVSVHEAALKQQIEQHNNEIAQLEVHLSASRQDIEKITAERNEINAEAEKLRAENLQEKQVFDKEKQQLLTQIAQSQQAEGQSQDSDQQQQALQLQLSEALKWKTILQDDKNKLQTQLAARPTAEQFAESLLMVKSLQAQIDLVQLNQTAPAAESKTHVAPAAPAMNSNTDSDKKIPVLQAKLDAALVELAEVKKHKSEVKNPPGVPAITPDQLNKKSAREGYAIGISLGDEILQMQAENSHWDSSIEKNIVLAGIIDAFQGKTKLSTDVLQNTLSEVSQREMKDQETLMTHLDKATKQYLDRFTKMKNTKKSPAGFWYNIAHVGDTPIPDNGTLDVVVKESLTNGDVITDMDASGTMLTQPLSDFPPIFREALLKLKNHGSITIVVPPELAYKEKGLPPKIPPNATIVYDLRIAETYP